MLPSCNACKRRKKRCDFELPTCKNCAALGVVCEYYDENLHRDIPRSLIKDLDDSIHQLKSEITKYERKIKKRTAKQNRTDDDNGDNGQDQSVGTFIVGPGSSVCYFGPGSAVSMVTIASKMLGLKSNALKSIKSCDILPQVTVPLDYTILDKDHTRVLIDNYLTSIYPVYPLLGKDLFHENLSLKSYPRYEQIFARLALLLSAAHLMRRRLDFVPIKIMLQQRVVHSLRSSMNIEDGDSLLAIIYYAIYELLDPEVGGSAGKALSLATAIAEKLNLTNLKNVSQLRGSICKRIPPQRLLTVLLNLDTSVSFSFGKPSSIVLDVADVKNFAAPEYQNDMLCCCYQQQLFTRIYAVDIECPIQCAISAFSDLKSLPDQSWIIASQLVSHECPHCKSTKDIFLSQILTTSKAILADYKLQIRDYNPLEYPTAVSNIANATLAMILLTNFFPHLGGAAPLELRDHISSGRHLLQRLASQWYYANTLSSYVDMASKWTK